MNKMPLVWVIQAHALYYQLRDYPVELRFPAFATDRLERAEEEAALHGR